MPGMMPSSALISMFSPMRATTEGETPLRTDSMITTALTEEESMSPMPGTSAMMGSSPILNFVPGMLSSSSSQRAMIFAVASRSCTVLPGAGMRVGGMTSSGSSGSLMRAR